MHVRSEVLLKTQQAMNDAGIDLPFPTSVEIFKNGNTDPIVIKSIKAQEKEGERQI